MPPPVLLATASYDRAIRFWEAPSGICMRTLNFQDSQVNCMCTSPDKAFLAAAGNKHLRLYDISAGSQLPVATIEAHAGNVTSLVYFRDGKYLVSGSEDGVIKIWDTLTMACKKKYAVRAAVNTLALHPDQHTIISGDQTGRLCLWGTRATDECQQELVPGGDVAIRSVSVAQQRGASLICAANNSGEVFVLSLTKQSTPASPEAANGAAAAQLPDDPHRGFHLKLVHTFKAHNKYILKCVLSPDSKLLATCSADYTIGLWHTSLSTVSNVKPWTCFKVLQGHFRWVWDCAFSNDGQYLVSASSDNTAKLWDIAKGIDHVNFSGHNKPVTCIVVDDRIPYHAVASK